MKYIKIIVAILFTIALSAQAEYKPSITFEKTIDTYNVKKDGTNALISENVILIETENGVLARV